MIFLNAYYASHCIIKHKTNPKIGRDAARLRCTTCSKQTGLFFLQNRFQENKVQTYFVCFVIQLEGVGTSILNDHIDVRKRKLFMEGNV